MSNSTYFLSILKHVEELEGASYLTKEEKSVFASAMLSELKPEILTPNCDALRAIVVKRLNKFITAKESTKDGSTAPLGPDVQRTPSKREEGTDDKPSDKASEDTTSRDDDAVVQPRPPVQSGHGKPKKQSKGRKTSRSQTRVHAKSV